jgi:type II restriction/modification system DNA methylase subunit YeeA
MDTAALKKFGPAARTLLREQVSARLNQVLAEGSAARREASQGVRELEDEISRTSRDQVVERVAYTWFNRLSALRFMDANGYTSTRVVSPADGQIRPEILAEAAAGVISEEVPEATAAQVRALLDNRTPSRDPQGEAYRLLLVAVCNHWHGIMPFMFEKIADCTELLMPDDLLSANSLLARLRAVMTEDACQDVEIIGWLYQFYISDKKDEVFAGLKKNIKITAENIPAATQLFTPHWIVRYLVENSLGRLWLLNRPQSKLADRMDYYIAPEQPETDFLCISRPEEIRICDPACGSGHMLTYAFDLLVAIYEEEGYEAIEIPGLILAHNLYGIEIDDRAGALAAFALAMKAAAKLGQRRFLRMEVRPDIVVMQNVNFTQAEMQDVAAVVGKDLFTNELREALGQFEQAKNFGSLIMPKLRDPAETLRMVEARDFGGDLLLKDVRERVVAVLRMAEAISSKYHVVVANPPYMGSKGMNGKLEGFAKEQYPNSKSDLFAMFMERALAMSIRRGMIAMINMQSWMFLSSFEKLRSQLLSNATLLSMAHLGERAFDTIGGAVVSTTAFVFENANHSSFQGDYIRLVDGNSEAKKATQLQKAIQNRNCGWFYRASAKDFEKIPGSPIAYSASDRLRSLFKKGLLGDAAFTRLGMATADNNLFLRFWPEISFRCSYLEAKNREEALKSVCRWFPYQKGGEFRKWDGNREFLVDWEGDGIRIQNFKDKKTGKVRSHNYNLDFIFKKCVTCNALASGKTSARLSKNSLFDNAGSSLFTKECFSLEAVMAFINSSVMTSVFPLISPTLNYQPGDIAKLPASFGRELQKRLQAPTARLVELARSDWDAYEISWDFTRLQLLSPDYRAETLEATYASLCVHWQGITADMRQLEEENNRIFIDAYGLQDELSPDVAIEEITLTCNPAYRYGMKGTKEVRESRLRADTLAELFSYAVGCMFGRYSLDAPGLILANQGDGMAEYLAIVPNPSFAPDTDNVIPMLDGDWFLDDISERFRVFLRVTFGEAHFQENLAFIEAALGKDIRKYFTRDFFNDHVKRYKKRSIYWLFSSPKGTFNALIYMHRYRPDTVSIVLNDYLRELRNKLEAYRRGQEALSISGEASQGQKTKALKEIEVIGKQVAELDAYERDVLFPLASRRIEIDLDDGVKANYPKFGDALKPIKGLAEAED